MTAATPPRQRAMSPKLSEAALTATRTWPAPGSGTSTSCTSTTSAGSPLRTTRAALTVLGTTWERSEPIRAAAALPASRTSSWLSGSLLMPAARLVTRLIPRTSMPASRAAIASRVVLMPTSWPPRTPAIRTSAGVS